MRRLQINLAILLMLSFSAVAQDKYYTKTGFIKFVSETPIITIKAYHKNIVSFIDINTGEIIFGVTMKGFKFRRPLAEEHFNENYAETDKYPNAKFKGKILNFNNLEFIDKAEFEVDIEGEMEIHGVKKTIKEKGILYMKKGKFYGSSEIVLHPEDYDIKIPSIVRDKIAETVIITVNMIYEPYIN